MDIVYYNILYNTHTDTDTHTHSHTHTYIIYKTNYKPIFYYILLILVIVNILH